jgi:chorismate synthase
MASNQPNIERLQALTLRPGHADATCAAKPTSSGPRRMLRSLQHQ